MSFVRPLILSSAASPAVFFRTYRPCRGMTQRAFPHPRLRSTLRSAYLGLLKYHLSEVSEIESILTEIRRDYEVARRLAIFAVKKLSRFECEETRTVRSNTKWNAVLQVFAF